MTRHFGRLRAILAADPRPEAPDAPEARDPDAGPKTLPGSPGSPLTLGSSREGRPVLGYRFGGGGSGPDPVRISLLAGCHADEPVGPRLLRHLVYFLAGLSGDDPLRAGKEWWIVPHANPDGEERNRDWQRGRDGLGLEAYDLASYLTHAVRELPGDDMEFGFPHGPGGDSEDDADDEDVAGPGGGPRPENRALHDWWRSAPGPFHLHVSLHGMGFAAGPWLLIEPTWAERARPLRDSFRDRVEGLGYELHDVERLGEKGFFRLGRGFATRPDSRHMRDHFLATGDRETADRFRPSSMEAIRALGTGPMGIGGDPLTLVTEMPLFLTPGVGAELGPPDPVAAEWRERIAAWSGALRKGPGAAGVKERVRKEAERVREEAERVRKEAERVREEAARAGLRPMPVADQMALQWAAIAGGIGLVE